MLIGRRKGCPNNHRAVQSGGGDVLPVWVNSGVLGPPCLPPSSEAGGATRMDQDRNLSKCITTPSVWFRNLGPV